MLDIAEVLRHGQTGQRHAHTGSRRFIHLAIDQRSLAQNAAFGHFAVKIVALTGAFANAGKNRIAVMGGSDVINQFLNQHGFADTGTTEQTDFAALCIGADQVNDLDAGFQQFRRRFLFIESRGRAVDGPMLYPGGGRLFINRFTQQVEHTAKARIANGNLDRPAGIHGFGTAHKAIGGGHSNAAHHVIANMLGNFYNQRFAVVLQFNRIQQFRQLAVGKADIQNRSHDLHDLTDVFFWHCTHSFE